MNKRSLMFRIGALLVLVAICAVMMVIGRGHNVYLDNKPITYEGKTYEAPYKVTAYVKGEQVAKLYEGERGAASCMGQRFEMTLEIMQQKNGSEEAVTVKVSLPRNMDGIILNINGVMAGLPEEAYLSEFVSAVPEVSKEEEVIPGDELIVGDI